MAFDLLWGDNISATDRFLLRSVSRLLSAPYSNFVTEGDYKVQLLEAGFEESKITMSDITNDVFPGLSGFLRRHDRELRGIGVTSFTQFRWAGRLFRWFATGRVVRAYIVVAKK